MKLPPRRYRGACGEPLCPCAVPGPVCDEWMGCDDDEFREFCPRCGWDLLAHGVELVRALIGLARAS